MAEMTPGGWFAQYQRELQKTPEEREVALKALREALEQLRREYQERHA